MSKISNDFLELTLGADGLELWRIDSGEAVILDWPACAVSLGGNVITPGQGAAPQVSGQCISQTFFSDELEFTVSVSLSGSRWFKKNVEVRKTRDLPTVDYIDVDAQSLDDELIRCGYVASNQSKQIEQRAAEEGSGFIAGCGYPLIGEKFFVGLEHPAAFNISENGQDYYLRHYPVWNGDVLEGISAVFSWSDDPAAGFRAYLNEIRLPSLKKPFVSFCTFWSDPYIAAYEYDVSYDNYRSLFAAFAKFGLKPDVFTLDAGWNDRRSIFNAKASLKGNAGVKQIQESLCADGIGLSLWLSHNGPMGLDSEFLKTQGFAVGGGLGSTYIAGQYGVMLDKKFEAALRQRFCDLIRELKPKHFKIDWDNDCATNADFDEAYPTINHVRQETINAMIRIAAAMREVNPDVVIRNGWWTSPWWLEHVNHIWLCDSGDSEFCSLPAKTQRDSSSTHRDAMYYAILRRDQSVIPLDCFDNHEFADALRNPFIEEPVSWTNALWLSFMRGSTYLAYTLQPEKLEQWQVESFKSIINFCRNHAEHIYVEFGRMIGGCPSHGEMYGFMMPGEKQSWCILRNPLPIPQKIELTGEDFNLPHAVDSVLQFYPNYQRIGDKLVVPAHGVCILIFDSEKRPLPFNVEFMAVAGHRTYDCFFPSSVTVNETVRPLVNEFYQVPNLEVRDVERRVENRKLTLTFRLRCPYRMREFEIQMGIKGRDAVGSKAQIWESRYPLATGSCYSLDLSEHHVNVPGYGEAKNPDLICGREQKYYSARLPDGGESFYRLEIENVDCDSNEIEIWFSGYEALSRKSIAMEEAPAGFDNGIPFQHPLGFPRQIRLPI